MVSHALIPTVLTPAVGKAVRAAARLHGGGTAFPGKVVEKLDPGFMARTLGQLPYGVVLVSGTNGKTTTTRIVASVLESLGLRVFTNPTGSNFTRGVVSALLDRVGMDGRLDADIAVLELDEAYAVHFVRRVKPRYTLLLNVMRDQLDRFGEIDNMLPRRARSCSTARIRASRRLRQWRHRAPPSGISGLMSRCGGSSRPMIPCIASWRATGERRRLPGVNRSVRRLALRVLPLISCPPT